MDFTYYTSLSIRFAIDLVNTLHPITKEDSLTSKEDLQSFLFEHEKIVALSAEEELVDKQAVVGLYREVLHGWEITNEDVTRVRAIREPLRTVFERASTNEREVAALLNEQLQLSGATPRISWQHGPLHLHFESLEAGCAHWLAVTTFMGLVTIICDYGADRLGVCASPSCHLVFIDISKNMRKRYCSEACAHRESVAAFRARKRQKSENND